MHRWRSQQVDMALRAFGPSGVRITKHPKHPEEHDMSTVRFIQRFGDKITGVLSGYDRLVLRGSLLAIVFPEGMKRVLRLKKVLLKDFGQWAQRMTDQLKKPPCKPPGDKKGPSGYLKSATPNKRNSAP